MFSRLLVNPDCPVGTAKMVETASEETIHAIGKSGLSEWISAVNTHHSATFRHCLLVNGLAVAFAQSLGFRHDDVLQLSVASAVHDIGKARIPLEILDKPSRLNASEVKTGGPILSTDWRCCGSRTSFPPPSRTPSCITTNSSMGAAILMD